MIYIQDIHSYYPVLNDIISVYVNVLLCHRFQNWKCRVEINAAETCAEKDIAYSSHKMIKSLTGICFHHGEHLMIHLLDLYNGLKNLGNAYTYITASNYVLKSYMAYLL